MITVYSQLRMCVKFSEMYMLVGIYECSVIMMGYCEGRGYWIVLTYWKVGLSWVQSNGEWEPLEVMKAHWEVSGNMGHFDFDVEKVH